MNELSIDTGKGIAAIIRTDKQDQLAIEGPEEAIDKLLADFPGLIGTDETPVRLVVDNKELVAQLVAHVVYAMAARPLRTEP